MQSASGVFVRHTLTRVELREPSLDSREEHQPLDRIVDSGVRGHLPQRLDNPVAGDGLGHDLIGR